MAQAPILRIVRPSDDAEQDSLDTDLAEDLGELLRQHTRYIAKIAYQILGPHAGTDEVDDIVQDVFLAALSGLAVRRSRREVRGFLATVTVRRATRRLRKRKLFRLLGFGVPASSMERSFATPSLTSEEQVFVRQIYEVLEQLPISQRVPWTLHYLEGETLPTVAQLCGCSLSTVKRRIAAAHTILERRLSDG